MFRKLKIGTKLTLSYLVLIIFMIIISYNGVLRLNQMDQEIDFLINDRYFKISHLEDVIKNTLDVGSLLQNIGIETDQNKINDNINQIEEYQDIDNQKIQILEQVIKSSRGKTLLNDAKEKLVKYREMQKSVINTANQTNNDKEKIIHILLNETTFVQAKEDFQKSLDNLISYQEELMTQSHDETMIKFQNSKKVIITMGVLSLIFGIAIAYLLILSIAPPISKIATIADNVSMGDLSSELPQNQNQDEIGILVEAFSRMHNNFKEMANVAKSISEGDLGIKIEPKSEKDILGNALNRMVNNLSTQIHEIIEGINVLSSSTSEIMATVTQLASGTAESAASVSEATSTVEEVKQTADLVNEKARLVSDNSKKTVEISESGKQSVQNAIEGMNRIQTQMESIANVIVKLSDQSQMINEIIETVNDLAEQSNLLAVNAAIEAAKAGEQGKGFAVVAQEIKSLAEQSKEATSQVGTILNDIQKSIGTAVMSTEQGNKAATEGLELTAEADKTIQILTESIQKAAEASFQIAASSNQQLAGMDQVTQAMETIKTATAQTAASTKQTEKAVVDLHKFGDNMKNLIEKYRI